MLLKTLKACVYVCVGVWVAGGSPLHLHYNHQPGPLKTQRGPARCQWATTNAHKWEAHLQLSDVVSMPQPINTASGIQSVAIDLENKFFFHPYPEGESEAVSIHKGWQQVGSTTDSQSCPRAVLTVIPV